MSGVPVGRPEAALVIWEWRGPGAQAIAAENSRLRIKGVVQGLVGGALGAALYFFLSPTVGTIVLTIASVVMLAALVSPGGLYRGIEGVFAALGRATGRGLTWLMLLPLFYLFFLPYGVLARRGRRDRLKRYFERDEASYWEPHRTSGSPERQF